MHAPKNPKAAYSLRAWGLPGPLKEIPVPQERGRFTPTDAAPKPTMPPLDLAGLRRGLASNIYHYNFLSTLSGSKRVSDC